MTAGAMRPGDETTPPGHTRFGTIGQPVCTPDPTPSEQPRLTPAQAAAHVALDRAMEPFARLEGAYNWPRMTWEEGEPHLAALLDLDGVGGIAVSREESWHSPAVTVTITSPAAEIMLRWTGNEATGADNGWRILPDCSSWPGVRYRRVLEAVRALTPLSYSLPGFYAPGEEPAPLDAGASEREIRRHHHDRAGRQWQDVQAWDGALGEVAAAVVEAQPWVGDRFDEVVRPILDRAWPVAAR